MLRSLVDRGTVRLVYRPIAILDRYSTTRYSTRALSSVGCVLNARPTAFPAYHDLLFARRPAENSAGLPDDELTRLAKQAGVDAADRVNGERYAGWASRVTDQASKDGVQGTPTVEVNGAVLQDFGPNSLRAAISRAAAGR